MSATFHQLLDDAARDELGAVDLTRLAAGARSTRRRRLARRSRTAGVLLVAAVVLLTTLSPGWTVLRRVALPASGSAGAGVSGHPVRIGWQWPVRDLPARPGPLAGLVNGKAQEWFGVRADGHRWRLPAATLSQVSPALSADGTRLAYLDESSETMVVRNLVTGEQKQLPSIGDGKTGPGVSKVSTIAVGSQAPSFWSPDDRHLLVSATIGSGGGATVIDTRTGAVRVVGTDQLPAGWLPGGRAVVTFVPTSVDVPNQKPEIVTGTTTLTGATVRIADLPGRAVRTLEMQPRVAWPAGISLAQWSAAVSPDGRQLLLVLDGPSPSETLQRFSLADGRQIGRSISLDDVESVCTASWVDDRRVSMALVSSARGLRRTVVDLGTGAARVSTVVDPHIILDGGCLDPVRDAMTGRAIGGGIWGTSTSAWSWRWRERIAWPFLGILLLTLLVRWSRRRTR